MEAVTWWGKLPIRTSNKMIFDRYLARVLLLTFVLTVYQVSRSNVTARNSEETTSCHYVIYSNPVLLPCTTVAHSVGTWSIGNVALNAGTFVYHFQFQNSLKVFRNSSLFIYSVSFYNEGTYYCKNSSTTLKVHVLYVIGMYNIKHLLNFFYWVL